MQPRPFVPPVDRRDRRLRFVMMGVALVGVGVSIYLLAIRWLPTAQLCTPGGGCDKVNNSIYAEVFGIPNALLGILAYLAIFALLALEPAHRLLAEWSPVAVFGMSLVGLLFSAYLTYIELYVLYAICPYCVASAVVITVLFALSLVRLKKFLQPLEAV